MGHPSNSYIPSWAVPVFTLRKETMPDRQHIYCGWWGAVPAKIQQQAEPDERGEAAFLFCLGKDAIPASKLFQRINKLGQMYLTGRLGGLRVIVLAKEDDDRMLFCIGRPKPEQLAGSEFPEPQNF